MVSTLLRQARTSCEYLCVLSLTSVLLESEGNCRAYHGVCIPDSTTITPYLPSNANLPTEFLNLIYIAALWVMRG